MREIVSIQIGQCGNKVGQKFWEIISQEHQIDKCGQFYGESIVPYQSLGVYYELGPQEIHVPRSILVDLDSGSLNDIKCGPIGQMFNPDSFVIGRTGGGNNWARGHYTEGAELMEDVLDVTRKQAECCECFQGFQMVHSIGGGTGSGMGSLLITKLNEEYQDRIINSFSIVPSPKVSETVVEPYNAVLSLKTMINNTDETICIDNEALYEIYYKTLKVPNPSLDELNQLVGQTMSGITSCYRFPGQLNTNLRKLMTNMCPFPRLHFFIPGFAPLYSRGAENYKIVTTTDLVNQIFDKHNQMAVFDPTCGRYLTCAAIFRGLVSTHEIDQQLKVIQERSSDAFANWVPNNIKTAICDVPPHGFELSATFITNTTAIEVLFRRLLDNFRAMLMKRAYVHWFTGEGMEEEEFWEAEREVLGIIEEYSKCNEQDEFDDLDDECEQPYDDENCEEE